MQWNEIRELFPRQWVLIDAVEAHSAENQRILDDVAVIQTFSDSVTAMARYQELHRRNPMLEMYVVHTDRDLPEIGEIRWLGLRPAS
jgi:hypothetical protein